MEIFMVQHFRGIVVSSHEWVSSVCARTWSLVTAYSSVAFLALVWVAMLMFFTYTGLWVELAKTEGDFHTLFYSSQSQYVALFVNIGIILMLLFDNHAAGRRFVGLDYYVPFIAVGLCIVIVAHCQSNIGGFISDYKWPISEKTLSIAAYCGFIIIVYYLKLRSLADCTEQKKGVS